MEKINKSKSEQKVDFEKLVELRGGKYCNRCYDRGYDGYDAKLEMYIPCSCILKHGMKLEQKKLAAKRVNEN